MFADLNLGTIDSLRKNVLNSEMKKNGCTWWPLQTVPVSRSTVDEKRTLSRAAKFIAPVTSVALVVLLRDTWRRREVPEKLEWKPRPATGKCA